MRKGHKFVQEKVGKKEPEPVVMNEKEMLKRLRAWERKQGTFKASYAKKRK